MDIKAGGGEHYDHSPDNSTDAFLASVVHSFQDAVISTDAAAVITSWNMAAAELFGHPADVVIGKRITKIAFPGPVQSVVQSASKITIEQLSRTQHTVHFQRSNRTLVIEIRLSPVVAQGGQLVGMSLVARDITAFSQISEDAAISQNRFRTITDVVPQIIWENDTEGKAIYFNQRFFDYSGCSMEELFGAGWQKIAHKDDTNATLQWEIALHKADIFETEVRLRRADNVYEWHLLRNVPLKDLNGKVLGWFGSATNVHALKLAQLYLQETSERLRTTVETAVDFAIITMDNDGNIIDWNSGAERMFGYTRRDAIGRFADLIFTPEDRYANIPLVEFITAKETGRSIDERWHIRKDGTRFFMSGIMAPIQHTRLMGFVKVARDITERKIAEEALFLAEQRKSLAVQTAQIGEWEWNVPADSVQWSERACHLLGLQPGAENNRSAPFLSIVHPEDAGFVKEELRTALDGLNVFQAEFRIIRADNRQVKWLNGYGRIISHLEERPLRMIGVIYDITDRKTIEKEKDDFINVASHELKTPVTSIKGYSDVLQEIFTETNQPQNAALIRKMDVQVDRLVKLIYNLLDSTTVAEGKMKLRPVTFDINELIDEQLQEALLLSGTHRLKWEPAPLPLIHADRNRIRQVLTNLISNAIKYSPDHTDIIITAKDMGDGVLVNVRDFGIGISSDEQSHIFQRYYRAHDEQITNYPGIGLGLYISAEIIKQHHGSIGVDSAFGSGSNFYFQLPYS